MRALLLTAAFATACATPIAGHQVNDNRLNREVVALMDAYRGAMEARDAERVLSLVADSYYEDHGNDDSSDDYGRDELAKKLAERFAKTSALHMRLEVKDVVETDDTILAHMKFTVRYRLDLPSGTRWERHSDVNEVVLVRVGDQLKIKQGL